MADPFAAPASGDFVDWDSLKDQLVLFTVHEAKTQKTKFDSDGPQPCIVADIAVLTGENAGDVIEESLIFGRVMVARLKPRVGGMVLTRVRKVTNAELTGKYGKNSFKWEFDDEYTEEDAEIARKWIAENIEPEPDPFTEK